MARSSSHSRRPGTQTSHRSFLKLPSSSQPVVCLNQTEKATVDLLTTSKPANRNCEFLFSRGGPFFTRFFSRSAFVCLCVCQHFSLFPNRIIPAAPYWFSMGMHRTDETRKPPSHEYSSAYYRYAFEPMRLFYCYLHPWCPKPVCSLPTHQSHFDFGTLKIEHLTV